uniref:Glutaredoxin domain-containing protein n=1 Tax=Heterosigma akashiwo TaxID=2829 RepID=A0A6V1R5C5_HETAK|mmetsp:Transcript_42812/g.62893  ORF Transcript_42812/g.62893 Transcript_42812/m.62893 type:complete len:161 (-) Transcript_42812:79-561(-)
MNALYLGVLLFCLALQSASGFSLNAGGKSSALAPKNFALRQASDDNADSSIAAEMEKIQAQAKGRIENMVNDNKVMLFMKGTKIFPQCGFSNTAVQILRSLDVEFQTFDVLSDPDIRQGIKDFSNWPTIPQLYVDKEFVGGCDIMIELFENGELKKMFEE